MFLTLTSLLVITLLVGCVTSTFQNSKNKEVKQTISVYDPNGKKVLETQDQGIVEKFSEHASQDDIDVQGTSEEIPQDAKLAYQFIVKDHSKYGVKMQIYDNHDYLAIQDCPIFGDINIPLTKEDADWFRQPNDW